ncbi:MAG: hypothetical protein LBC63_06450 [Holophagales bacterium]|jgi:hypothetical protein|nr:hypothetical protein [Holophagales bacterium]
METPKEVRSLIDQLGQALVQAIISDTAGQDLIKQIQQTGFEVGIMLEATVALHQKDKEIEGHEEECDDESMEIAEALARYFSRDYSRAARHKESETSCENIRNFQWSEEDKALMCNFRIRLD